MSKLDDLIKQYCPDGVEYKRLGDIGTFRRGGNFQKKDMTSSGVPCIHYGQIYVYYGLFSSSTISFLPAEIAVTQRKANPGEIIIAITSENIEDVCKAVVWEGSEPVCVSGHSSIFESGLNPRYVAYYLQTEAFQQQKRKYAHGVKVIEISPEQIGQCMIPCPDRNVQDEIVRILDSFTKLTAELTAELTARRAQYEYYRDKLLTFDDETAIVKRIKDMLDQSCGGPEKVEYKKLCDVGSFRRGGNFQKKEMVQCGVPCIHYGQIYMHYGLVAKDTISFLSEDVACNQKTANPGEVIIAITSENVEDVCKAVVWEGETPVCISGHTAVFNTSMNPRFVAYWFQTEMFQAQKRKYAHGVKVIEISPDQVGQCRIPCPPRSVQNEIISILDKFNKLTTDISTGLPAEISLRQKQYEHYRDRLLNFNGGGMP